MQKIIITDLTRFQNDAIFCTAGIDELSGECIRPMPYLKAADCRRLEILPGSILTGEFSVPSGLVGPHLEDRTYKNLTLIGSSTSEDFRAALRRGVQVSVQMGFNVKLADRQKFVPIGNATSRSIITLSVDPKTIEVVEDVYKPGKVKMHFVDSDGVMFRFMPITDLGFHQYAQSHRATRDLQRLNDFIRQQPEVLLRVGLARQWNNGSQDGYWMQINGIYTFPEFVKELRSHR